MKTGIFLDDERWPSDVTWIDLPKDVDWITVRTTLDFQDAIKYCFDGHFPEYFSFDHDLQEFYPDENGNEYEKTGYDAVKFMVEYALDHDLLIPNNCFFHT